MENGIPAGGLFTGAEEVKTEEEVAMFRGEAGVAYDPNYHEAGDTIDNLNLEAFFLNTKSIANSVALFATGLTSIPAGAPGTVRRDPLADARRARRDASHAGRAHAACNAKSKPAK